MAENNQNGDSEHRARIASMQAEDVLQELDVDPQKGLSDEAVKSRREEHGPNELPTKEGESPWILFLKQFKDFLILILFLAAGISWYAGQMANVYIILAVILFNAFMGFFQEYKAEKAVESIKGMVKKKATLLRNGREVTVQAREVVPGDIMILGEGQTIPADGRVLEVKNFRTNEASLTGESEPVGKATGTVKEGTAIADQTNMVWKGTNSVKGSARAVAVKTGEKTQIGQIAQSMGEMEQGESNFRRKTRRLARKMAGIAIATSSIVFALGYWYRDFSFNEILLVTIATLVSSIPEGLPVVISIVLAIGANRMASRNAIIREFTATEVMGSITTILTDKTGTITQSVLTVKRLFTGKEPDYEVTGQGHQLEGRIERDGEEVKVSQESEPALKKLLTIARYCNNTHIQEPQSDEDQDQDQKDQQQKRAPKITGDPTEVALRVLGEKSGIAEQVEEPEILDDIPFNSEQKFRASLIKIGDEKEILVVGAPEVMRERSKNWMADSDTEALDENKLTAIDNHADKWADNALRVIALAHRRHDGEADEIEVQDVENLTWTGFAGMIDPARPKVEDAIKDCHGAGIRVVMVTGDHKNTAAAIARQVGILREDQDRGDHPVAYSGSELNEMSDEEFADAVRNVQVFARVSPDVKLRIAEHLQERGELIGMTGDGVNDAPALKKADVGIAMGQRGTDVAKDAARIVLSDDNFASIVAAIREGRIVFKNVTTTVYFLLTTNFASTSTLIVALIMGLPIPLTAVQILWVNMVTDGVMDVAKATERGHGEMMQREPIKKDERFLTWKVLPYLVLMSVIMVTLTISAFKYYQDQGLETARTGAFLIISMTQVYNAFNMRDLNKSLFEIGFFTNKWVNIAFLASLILQITVVKVPFLRDLFGFDNIGWLDYLAIIAISTLVLAGGELLKLIHRKFGWF
jgi:Ca2+-transporting ATPase